MIENYLVQREHCRSKKAYDKRGAVTVKNKRWKEDHVKLREYPCPICRKWHVSSCD